jgi:hypothetical protein
MSSINALTPAITALNTNLVSINSALASYNSALLNNTNALSSNSSSLENVYAALVNLDATLDRKDFGGGGGGGPTTASGGGRILGFSKGGSVPGSGRGDKVPALLEPGEVVMSNTAVNRYGRGNLVRMNKYARGGWTEGKGEQYQFSHLDAGPSVSGVSRERNRQGYGLSNIGIMLPRSVNQLLAGYKQKGGVAAINSEDLKRIIGEQNPAELFGPLIRGRQRGGAGVFRDTETVRGSTLRELLQKHGEQFKRIVLSRIPNNTDISTDRDLQKYGIAQAIYDKASMINADLAEGFADIREMRYSLDPDEIKPGSRRSTGSARVGATAKIQFPGGRSKGNIPYKALKMTGGLIKKFAGGGEALQSKLSTIRTLLGEFYGSDEQLISKSISNSMIIDEARADKIIANLESSRSQLPLFKKLFSEKSSSVGVLNGFPVARYDAIGGLQSMRFDELKDEETIREFIKRGKLATQASRGPVGKRMVYGDQKAARRRFAVGGTVENIAAKEKKSIETVILEQLSSFGDASELKKY